MDENGTLDTEKKSGFGMEKERKKYVQKLKLAVIQHLQQPTFIHILLSMPLGKYKKPAAVSTLSSLYGEKQRGGREAGSGTKISQTR